MNITNIEEFLSYYERIRNRTRAVITCVPDEKLEWTYKTGKFTIGDIIRHIAAIERYLYAEIVAGRSDNYLGCGADFASGLDETLQFFERLHQESIEIFGTLTKEQLNRKIKTPMGYSITTWKWLRALLEHEIHHRGQIYLYLGILDIKTPPLFGLTSEEVMKINRNPKSISNR